MLQECGAQTRVRASPDLTLEILKQGCEGGPRRGRHSCSGVMAGHSGSGSRSGSTPFPQLLPGLDECLHLSGTGKTVVDQPAILIRLLVKITNRRHAEVREVVTEFVEVLLAQNLRLLAIRTARHWKSDSSIFALCSPMPVRRGSRRGRRGRRLVCSSDNDNHNDDGRAG